MSGDHESATYTSLSQALGPEVDVLLGNLREGVMLIDSHSRILAANMTACQLLRMGFPHPPSLPDTPECSQIAGAIRRSVGAGHRATVEVAGREEGQRLEARIEAIGGNGSTSAVAVVVLESRECARGNAHSLRIIAEVAHELRTPLTAIKAQAEMILDGVAADPHAVQDCLRSIVEESDTLAGLVGDFLDMHRMQEGVCCLSLEPVALEPMVESVMARMRRLSIDEGVTMISEIDPSLPLLLADRSRINQILCNLIGNALKFTPDAGSVTVRAAEENSQARITVQDTGVGIYPDQLDRVWEPFYRGDATPHRIHGGTGLGLPIVKRSVELQGGEVGASSVPGEGSSFWFTMPLCPASLIDGDGRDPGSC